MEIIVIDLKTFEKIMFQLEHLQKRLDGLIDKNQPKCLKEWVDNEYLCRALNVSLRTLQTYRDTGLLAYSRMNGKIFYKQEDVDAFIRGRNRLLNEKKK